MIIDYRRLQPPTELERFERRAWLGFAIWIPGMIIASILFGTLMSLIRWMVN